MVSEAAEQPDPSGRLADTELGIGCRQAEYGIDPADSDRVQAPVCCGRELDARVGDGAVLYPSLFRRVGWHLQRVPHREIVDRHLLDARINSRVRWQTRDGVGDHDGSVQHEPRLRRRRIARRLIRIPEAIFTRARQTPICNVWRVVTPAGAPFPILPAVIPTLLPILLIAPAMAVIVISTISHADAGHSRPYGAA